MGFGEGEFFIDVYLLLHRPSSLLNSFSLSTKYSYRNDDVHDTSCCLIRETSLRDSYQV